MAAAVVGKDAIKGLYRLPRPAESGYPRPGKKPVERE